MSEEVPIVETDLKVDVRDLEALVEHIKGSPGPIALNAEQAELVRGMVESLVGSYRAGVDVGPYVEPDDKMDPEWIGPANLVNLVTTRLRMTLKELKAAHIPTLLDLTTFYELAASPRSTFSPEEAFRLTEIYYEQSMMTSRDQARQNPLAFILGAGHHHGPPPPDKKH